MDPCIGLGDAAGTGVPGDLQGPGLCHPPMDVTFQSTAGAGRGQNKTSPKVKPSLKPTASPQGPAAPARPGFLLSLLSW